MAGNGLWDILGGFAGGMSKLIVPLGDWRILLILGVIAFIIFLALMGIPALMWMARNLFAPIWWALHGG